MNPSVVVVVLLLQDDLYLLIVWEVTDLIDWTILTVASSNKLSGGVQFFDSVKSLLNLVFSVEVLILLRLFLEKKERSLILRINLFRSLMILDKGRIFLVGIKVRPFSSKFSSSREGSRSDRLIVEKVPIGTADWACGRRPLVIKND